MPQNQWHMPQNQRHMPQNKWHFLLSLFFAILKLKLVSKIFGNSCLIDLQIEASLVRFEQELLFELNVVSLQSIYRKIIHTRCFYQSNAS